jgi:hypothetical protein
VIVSKDFFASAKTSRTHSLSLCDHAKQISLVIEIHDDEDEVPFLVHLMQGDDVGMSRGELV